VFIARWTAAPAAAADCAACWPLLPQALKPNIFVSVPRLWNRIYDRVMAQIRESSPLKRRLFETAYAHKKVGRRGVPEGRIG
jgi:long-chain acyl-CoA synthetase